MKKGRKKEMNKGRRKEERQKCGKEGRKKEMNKEEGKWKEEIKQWRKEKWMKWRKEEGKWNEEMRNEEILKKNTKKQRMNFKIQDRKKINLWKEIKMKENRTRENLKIQS